jgi:hypothetical protein
MGEDRLETMTQPEGGLHNAISVDSSRAVDPSTHIPDKKRLQWSYIGHEMKCRRN